jgi:hypothetical protein
MFILDGKPLSPDAAFTHNGIQYPANWLRLASPEEREAIGITEVPDPAPVDFRFYWDTGIPKDHTQLVGQWITSTKVTAGTLLTPSDWYITRQAETGLAVPQDVLDRRAEIRAYSNTKEQAILATTSTEELAAYVTSEDYNRWEPEEPSA